MTQEIKNRDLEYDWNFTGGKRPFNRFELFDIIEEIVLNSDHHDKSWLAWALIENIRKQVKYEEAAKRNFMEKMNVIWNKNEEIAGLKKEIEALKNKQS